LTIGGANELNCEKVAFWISNLNDLPPCKPRECAQDNFDLLNIALEVWLFYHLIHNLQCSRPVTIYRHMLEQERLRELSEMLVGLRDGVQWFGVTDIRNECSNDLIKDLVWTGCEVRC